MTSVAMEENSARDNKAWVGFAQKRLSRWRNEPELWAKEVLGIELTEPQARFCNSVVTNKRTVVRSANGMGKTHGAAVLLLWYVSTRRGIVISTAPTWSHVRLRLWGEVKKLYNKALIPLGGDMLECRWKLGDYWEAYGLSTREESNFQGGHAENILLLFDEAQGVAPKIWEAAESMMVGEKARWLAIGNPLEPKGDFFKAFTSPDSWNPITLSALEHPNYIHDREIIPGAVTKGWAEARRLEWGENDPRYQARILGVFPEAGADRIVPMAYLEKSCETGSDEGEGYHLGIDVARFGSDETVFAIVKDNVLEEEIRLAGKDGNEIAGRVLKECERLGIPRKEARRIHVDVIGVGASVVDALKAEGWRADPVSFAEKARGTYKEECGPLDFANQRAELYWATRELLRLGLASIPRKFGSTWEELTEPSYSYDRKGRLLVEPKDAIKKRINRSPDGADAFCLALARKKSTKPTIILNE